MMELVLVELRHGALGVEREEGRVGGVDEEADQVADVVDAEDEDVEDDEGQLGRAVDGGDQGQEHEEGVADQEHLGALLLSS